jgi:multidrug efflux pump subunit AcrA (membrane-fusion protein)
MPGTVVMPEVSADPTQLTTRSRSQLIRVVAEAAPVGWTWRSFTWPAATLGVAVSVVAVFQPWQAAHSEGTHSPPITRAEVVRTVNVATPDQSTGGSVQLPATIRPWQVAALNARVSGYLKSWHAELGTKVEAGQLLAEIETPELDQEVAEGEAQAAEAAAAAVQAQAERTEAEAELNVSLAQLARVHAETELVKTQLARREKLVARGAVAQEEYDTFQRQYEARIADVRAAEADVARRRTSLDTRAAVIAARKATASSRQANVERLKELQSFQKIVAPFAGLVTQRRAEVGALVTPASEPLYVVEDLSRVRIQVNVPQTNAAQLQLGSTATIHVPESRQPATSATITRLAGAIDPKTRTMLAEIELDNTRAGLQPGSYAQVSLNTSTTNSVWTIPASTIQMRVEGPHVAIVNEYNQVDVKPITLGRDLGGRVQVTAGIAGGERLIINPTDDLVGGTNVKINDTRIAQK